MSEHLTDEVLDPPKEGPIQRTIADVLKELKAEPQSREYAINVYGVDVLFRCPESSDEVDLFKKGCREFVKRMMTTDVKAQPKPFQDAMTIRTDRSEPPMNGADLVNAFTIHYWSSVNNLGGQVNQPDALTWVALKPGFCASIVQGIEVMLADGQAIMVSRRILDAKKNSKTITKKG